MNVEVLVHRSLLSERLSSLMAVSVASAKNLQKAWEGLCWEGTWPFLDRWDVVGLHTTASICNVPKQHGPHGEFFFFLKKERTGGLQGDGGLWALYLRGDNESVCHVRLAHDG